MGEGGIGEPHSVVTVPARGSRSIPSPNSSLWALPALSTRNFQFLDKVPGNDLCNVEWVGRVFVFTHLIIPNSPPPNSSFDAGASK